MLTCAFVLLSHAPLCCYLSRGQARGVSGARHRGVGLARGARARLLIRSERTYPPSTLDGPLSNCSLPSYEHDFHPAIDFRHPLPPSISAIHGRDNCRAGSSSLDPIPPPIPTIGWCSEPSATGRSGTATHKRMEWTRPHFPTLRWSCYYLVACVRFFFFFRFQSFGRIALTVSLSVLSEQVL